MQTLPAAVQLAFPCKPDQIPDRPWWSLENASEGPAFHYGRRLRRTDGLHSQDLTPLKLKPLEGVDAEKPLPHPGFRAGQVWAKGDGNSIVILRMGGIWPKYPIITDEFSYAPEQFNAVYPYLMADPACPWLAPWAPVKILPLKVYPEPWGD